MEAGESIDSVGHPASQGHPDDAQSQPQIKPQDQDEYPALNTSKPDSSTGIETGAPDLTVMDALPSIEQSALSSFLPGGRGDTSSTLHTEGNADSLEQQIQAFTAGLAGQFEATQPVDASALSTAFNTPSQGQATPATAEDVSSFDSLLASLMPSPAQETPDSRPDAPSSQQSVQKNIQPPDTVSSSAADPAPPQSSTQDNSAQSFVDNLLRQANLFPTPAGTVESDADGSAVATPSEPTVPAATGSEDALAASLEQFMASLQARVSSSLTSDGDSEDQFKPKTPVKSAKPLKKPKRILGKRKYREIGPMERKSRVEKALSEYISSIDTLIKPNLVTGPIPAPDPKKTKMTTIRCAHASVAQKSYGSEKRFFNPPPIVTVIGPLRRYAEHGPAILTTSSTSEDADEEEQSKVSFLVRGETEEFFSNEHVATLDEQLETKIRSLYVTPTGRSKHFRLQLNLLRPSGLEPHLPIFSPLKKSRVAEALSPAVSIGSTGPGQNGHDGAEIASETLSRLPKGLSWASFESAPVTIISKSSKKTAKPRGQTNQVQNGSLISLFNRINSQTARTKYMHTAVDGGLTVHSGDWSTYRVTLISRPPLADLAGAEEGSVTYGSTIVLTDLSTGWSSDPLVVCKVDKGQVQLPQVDPPAELLKAGSGNRSKRVPIDPILREKLAAISATSSKDGTTGKTAKTTSTSVNGDANSGDRTKASLPSKGPPTIDAEKAGTDSQTPIKIEGEDTPQDDQSTPVKDSSRNTEDLNPYGPVGQLQKVALMRFVPSSESDSITGDSEHLESDFSAPRNYLCASMIDSWKHLAGADQLGQQPLSVSFAQTHESGFGSLEAPATIHDPHKTAESNSIAYVTPKTTLQPKNHGPGRKVVDEVDDAFIWTVIGISRFEYSYFDTSATQASKDEGPCEVPMTPFPLITSMPTYDQAKHDIHTTVTNFIVPAAITSDPIPLDVWIGSLGPLKVEHSIKTPPSASAGSDPEAFISVHLPPIRDLLKNALQDKTEMKEVPAHFLLPLIFVNDSDGTAYHSGRHIVCEDLVELMKATGHETSADVLKQLGFGLGPSAGPPEKGAWSLRII